MATESNVLHVFADYPEPLSTAAARYAGVPEAVAADWLRFGAVYCDGVRTLEEKSLRGGEYLRIHRKPRRFPLAGAIDWLRTIVATEPTFLVVDKPAGVPIHPTLDNAHENVVVCLGNVLGERLFVTQRLDLPTSGLCIVARTKGFQSAFNRLLASGGVKKRYRAIVRGVPAEGRHVAWQEPSDRAPRRMAHDAQPGWKRCSLVVEAVEPGEAGTSVATILLETGRTHQIRAQMALMGHPLPGDTLYDSGTVTALEEDDEAPSALTLRSCEITFALDGRSYAWRA